MIKPITFWVLGNLWPETTAKFYLRVVMKCRERMQRMPRIVIVGVDLPEQVEKEGIKEGKLDDCLPYLIDAAKTLEKARADFFAIACNTLYLLEKEIQQSVDIPLFSIVLTACDFVLARWFSCVGIIGTVATKQHWLYRNPLSLRGIEVIEPDDTQQKNIGDAIYRLVTNARRGDELESIMSVVEDMRAKWAECILLACTDLQLVISHDPTNQVYDTLELLADRCVDMMDGVAKELNGGMVD